MKETNVRRTRIFSCRNEQDPDDKGKRFSRKKANDQLITSDPSLSFAPMTLREIVGQERVVNQLRVLCSACLKEGKPLPHILFLGPPGLGKTTIAKILACEMNTSIEAISCPFIQTPSSLVSVLSRLSGGEILFLDEIHSLNRACSESLYNAMDYFSLELLIERHRITRSLAIPLRPFTLIGATTYPGRLSNAFFTRFEAALSFESYSVEELKKILLLASKKWKVDIDNEAAGLIAIRSRGTPRLALHFLKWSRSFLLSSRGATISRKSALDAFDLLGVDDFGLSPTERKILSLIETLYDGGPVGIRVLASHLGENVETIEQLYESHLLKEGFLVRSSRGRRLTQKGRDYLARLKGPSIDHE
ncbi:Holliday junction branch migration DNA helicase RuvB [Candidatus Similichlamydia epinepheli]|uniref:Holliday junction branch migration DNA helicase RuvB n=1 Tax=Candidatus Similichlamydia epinepheli TaxID=1903953 RepID=UPI000D35CC78|nr:Holliday junction branch migration DNA helicase RuvB [Candidatus Similichlamydia epinepheli]